MSAETSGQTEAEKKDYLKGDLRDRGWTDGMIKRWLGEPDERNHRSGGGEYYLFRALRVHAAEAKPEWQSERDKWRKRAQKAKETKRQAENMPQAQREEIERGVLAKVGILPALFALNRETKRLREAAKHAYGNRRKARASKLAKKKRDLYALKNQAIERLVREGKLRVIGFHLFKNKYRAWESPEKPWAELLEGDGYRFHRPAPRPDGELTEFPILDEIKAKPVQEGDLSVATAEKAVRGYLQGWKEVEVYEWPGRP